MNLKQLLNESSNNIINDVKSIDLYGEFITNVAKNKHIGSIDFIGRSLNLLYHNFQLQTHDSNFYKVVTFFRSEDTPDSDVKEFQERVEDIQQQFIRILKNTQYYNVLGRSKISVGVSSRNYSTRNAFEIRMEIQIPRNKFQFYDYYSYLNEPLSSKCMVPRIDKINLKVGSLDAPIPDNNKIEITNTFDQLVDLSDYCYKVCSFYEAPYKIAHKQLVYDNEKEKLLNKFKSVKDVIITVVFMCQYITILKNKEIDYAFSEKDRERELGIQISSLSFILKKLKGRRYNKIIFPKLENEILPYLI